MLARELDLAPVDGDNRDRKVVLGPFEAVLNRDVVRARSMLRCELPVSCPELEPGETPQRAGASRLVAVAPLLMLAVEQDACHVPSSGRRESVDERHRSLL